MPLPLPAPVFDANATGASLGALPEWDLTDLYPAPDAPEFDRDMAWLEKACADFAAAYEGKLATLDAAALLKCVEEYEAIDVTAGRIMSYAGLRYYQNTMDSERAKFMADAQDRVTTFTTPLVFSGSTTGPCRCSRGGSAGGTCAWGGAVWINSCTNCSSIVAARFTTRAITWPVRS